MPENRCSCGSAANASANAGRETVCIDTYRVLDSCRDKDCFENMQVFLSDFGQSVVSSGATIKVKCASIIWTYVGVDPIQFNNGFYQVSARYYVKLVLEGCSCLARPQEFEGIAVAEKKVILYGSEGNVSIFRSRATPEGSSSCPNPFSVVSSNNMPVGVVEVASPVVLGVKVVEPGCECVNCCPCVCSCSELPECVTCCVNGTLGEGGGEGEDVARLYATIGFFSVIRIERPAQYIVNVGECAVPDKECVGSDSEDDPCGMFASMAFPINEFYPPSLTGNDRGCGKCR